MTPLGKNHLPLKFCTNDCAHSSFKPCILSFFVLALIFCGLLLVSCGKSDTAGKTEIIFWHSMVSSTVPALRELVEEFEKEHPTISIKTQYVPTGDALIQKLITAVQSKTAPDISWIHSHFLPSLVQANAILPMQPFIDGADGISQEDIQDIYPALLQAASWRGILYSMPMEATNLGLLYNKDLFRKASLDPERPPRTWDELYEYAKKLTVDSDGDGKYEQVGLFIPIFPASGPLSDWMVWQWMPFLWQAGGEIINADQTQVLFNSDAGVKALSYWKKIYDALNLKSFTPDYEAAFPSGHLAMAFDGPWNLPRWEGRKIDWAIGPLPAGPVKRATNVGGEYIAIFKQSKHPEAAWTFIKWLIKPEVQARWSMKSGYLPIRQAVLNIKEYREFLDTRPGLKTYVEQMEFGQSPPPIDYYSLEISRAIAEAIERGTLGNVDPKKALDEAAAKANKLLQSVVAKQ
jgi:multiple sugar transport system substrate-binding protein